MGQGVHAAALSSGTAGLHLALILAGVKPGDRVICPSLTFIGTTNPVFYCGAELILIDSERDSWNMSPTLLEAALSQCRAEGKPAKAVISVNLYGQSADMNAIQELCTQFGAKLIEDAAESLGADYNGRKSGTFGDFSVLSFNGNKIITTSGGGMLLSRDQSAINLAKILAAQARDPQPFYEHSMVGFNYRLSSVCAAIGRGQLLSLDQKVQRRREIFARYSQELGRISGVQMMSQSTLGNTTSWLSVLTIDPQIIKHSPLSIVAKIAAKRIELRPVWKPLHLQPIYRGVTSYLDKASTEGLGVCTEFFNQGLCLPSGSSLTYEMQTLVINELTAILKSP